MKHLKKAASLLLVLVLALSLTVPAWAEDTHTVTIENKETLTNHTFEAYQIFSGDVAEDGKKLSNVEWAEGFDSSSFVEKLNKAGFENVSFEGLTTAAEVAEQLAKVDAAGAIQVARMAYESKGTVVPVQLQAGGTEMAEGYYLIVDNTKNLDGSEQMYNASLLQVVGDVNITAKNSDAPEVEKKVKDNNDTDGTETGWQDSADYDIGDDVPFQVTATIKNISQYKTYKVVFEDEFSAGLVYNSGSLKITVGERDVTDAFAVNTDNGKLTLTCEDILAAEVLTSTGGDIVASYTAKLTGEGVKIGAEGNPNTVTLKFSNNPDTTDMGEVKDKVTVFTFQVIVNKVDGDGNPLENADFTLSKLEGNEWVKKDIKSMNTETVVIDGKNFVAGTVFTFKSLDDGRYRIEETTTPDGYNTAAPIYFTIAAEHDADSADPTLTKLTATRTDENGEALKNDLGEDILLTAATNDGSVRTEVVNNSGAVLPETGGIGTTIFYTVGGILVVGAAILLVTKKRMHNN